MTARKPIPTVDQAAPAAAASVVDAIATTATIDRIVHVAPTELAVGPNIRKTTDKAAYTAIADSIREVGVLTAVEAFTREDGTLEVVTGQTRTHAAVEVGTASIPVRIIDRPDGAGIVERQLIENTARAPMTRADEVAAARQLAFDFKLPAAQIAKRTTLKVTDVEHAVKVADSPVALAGLGRNDMPLEVLAAIADSGLTAEEAKPVLESHYNPGLQLKRAIEAKEQRTLIQSLTDKARNAGNAVTDVAPSDAYGSRPKGSKAVWVSEIIDDKTGKAMTPAKHKTCPGHAVWVGVRGYNGKVESLPVCLDPKAGGHKTTIQKTAHQQYTAEERAVKKQNTALNKAWDDVTAVRLAFIRDSILTRKKLPDGWWRLIVDDFTEEHAHYSPNTEVLNNILRLGAEPQPHPRNPEYLFLDEGDVRRRMRKVADRQPEHAIFALAIARHENALNVRGGWEKLSLPYLAWLVEQGYVLTEEETIVRDRYQTIADRRAKALAAVAAEEAEAKALRDQAHEQADDGEAE